MTDREKHLRYSAELRRRAEATARERAVPTEDLAALQPDEIREIIHELRVHQIQLEMQNEELRQTQHKLASAQERYFDLYDLAPVGYLTLSEKGLILEGNLAAANLLGASRGTLTRLPFSQFVFRDDQDLYYLNRNRDSGPSLLPSQYEIRLVRQDGTIFWAHLVFTTVQQIDGVSVCRVVLSDITECHQAEEALQESELRFRKLFQDVQNLAVQGYGADGTTRYWNHASELLYGYSAQEAIGRNLVELIVPPEMRDEVKKAIQWMAETGQPIPASELPLMRKDGSRVPVFSNHTLIRIPGREQELFCIDIDLSERKRAEEALRESEERHRLIFESASDAMLLIDSETTRIIRVNKRALELYGYEEEELLALKVTDISADPEVTRQRFHEARQALEGDVHVPLGCRHRKKDGTVFPVEITACTIPVHHRQVILVAARDITERKQAEEALQKSEELYRLLVNSLNDGFFVADDQGRLTFGNAALAKILGCSGPDEFLGKHILHFTAPSARDRVVPLFSVAASGGTIPPLIEVPILRKDGEVVQVEVKPTVLTHENGRVTTQGLLMDVHERKQMEEALRLSEKQRLLAQEAANAQLKEQADSLASIYYALDSVGLIVCDLLEEDGCIKIFNVGAEKLLGYRQEEAVGRSIALLYPPEIANVLSERIVLLHQGQSMHSFDTTLMRKSGERFPAVVSLHPFDLHEGRFRKCVGVYRDISELMAAQTQLQESNIELEKRVEQRTRELQETREQYLHAEKLSVIGKLSASIAHEFNNPLQSISSILKGLRKRAILEEEDRILLEAAIGEGDRMKELIRSLQDFNRPSSGRKVWMDVHKSLDAMLLLHKSDFKGKRISVELDYAEQLPQILAVPDQFKQVILNLLTNAADACSAGGLITISTRKEADRVSIAIKDTGTGITSEDMSLIFQPFYTTKPAVKGTGLGLSVSYGIIKRHQGEIRVESRPGEGATFTVLLPITGGADIVAATEA